MTEAPRHVQATPGRQGQTGTGARWVLRISLALIVVIFAALFIGFFHRPMGNGGQEHPNQRYSTTPNTVREAASTAAPGSVPAQAAGRSEQTTGG